MPNVNYSNNFLSIAYNAKNLPVDTLKEEILNLMVTAIKLAENPERFAKKWMLTCHPDKSFRDFKYDGDLIITQQAMRAVAEALIPNQEDKSDNALQTVFFDLIQNAKNDLLNNNNAARAHCTFGNVIEDIEGVTNDPFFLHKTFAFTFKGRIQRETYNVPPADLAEYQFKTHIKKILFPENIQSNRYDYAQAQLAYLENLLAYDPIAMSQEDTNQEKLEWLNQLVGDANNSNLLPLVYKVFLDGPYRDVAEPWPSDITIKRENGIDMSWHFNVPSKSIKFGFNKFFEAFVNIISHPALHRLSVNFGEKFKTAYGYLPLAALGLAVVGLGLLTALSGPLALGLILPSVILETIVFSTLGLVGLILLQGIARKGLDLLADINQATITPPKRSRYMPSSLYELSLIALHPLKQIALSPLKAHYQGGQQQALKYSYPLRVLAGAVLSLLVALSYIPLYLVAAVIEKSYIAHLRAPNVAFDAVQVAKGIPSKLHNGWESLKNFFSREQAQDANAQPAPEQANDNVDVDIDLEAANPLLFRHMQDGGNYPVAVIDEVAPEARQAAAPRA